MSEDKDIATIVNILELIFSDQEGEIVNAARIAKRKMAAVGMTKLSDLFNHFIAIGVSIQPPEPEQAEKPAPKTKPKQDRSDRRFAAFAFQIFNHPDFDERLSDRQKDAIENWTTWRRSFTDKMRTYMMAIGDELGLHIDDMEDEKPPKKPSPHDRDERERQNHFRTI